MPVTTLVIMNALNKAMCFWSEESDSEFRHVCSCVMRLIRIAHGPCLHCESHVIYAELLYLLCKRFGSFKLSLLKLGIKLSLLSTATLFDSASMHFPTRSHEAT